MSRLCAACKDLKSCRLPSSTKSATSLGAQALDCSPGGVGHKGKTRATRGRGSKPRWYTFQSAFGSLPPEWWIRSWHVRSRQPVVAAAVGGQSSKTAFRGKVEVGVMKETT